MARRRFSEVFLCFSATGTKILAARSISRDSGCFCRKARFDKRKKNRSRGRAWHISYSLAVGEQGKNFSFKSISRDSGHFCWKLMLVGGHAARHDRPSFKLSSAGLHAMTHRRFPGSLLVLLGILLFPALVHAVLPGMETVSTARAEARADKVGDLLQTHAILYFGRSDCGYCRDQALVLKALSKETGLRILAITLDGRPLHMFPDAKPDNGLAMLASGGNGVDTTPTLYLIERNTKKMSLLASGAASGEDIKQRLSTLILMEREK
jgi:thiol-disulfide isomerase/thioredoxin